MLLSLQNINFSFGSRTILEDANWQIGPGERIGLVGTAGYQLKTARRSLNILFQEWGNRGIHFWEVGNTNINLVVGSSTNVDATDEGYGVYTFYI